VLLLGRGEAAFDKVLVVDVDAGDELKVKSNLTIFYFFVRVAQSPFCSRVVGKVKFHVGTGLNSNLFVKFHRYLAVEDLML